MCRSGGWGGDDREKKEELRTISIEKLARDNER